MPGLLNQLQTTFQSSGLEDLVAGQASLLATVSAQVGSLVEGPEEWGQLMALLGDPPRPPGLDGIGSLISGLGELDSALPGDLGSLLSPLMDPLAALSGEMMVAGSMERVVQGGRLLQGLMEFTTKGLFRGASGLPLDPSLWGRQPLPGEMPDITKVEEALSQMEAALTAFGTSLDAAVLLDLFQRAAPAWDMAKWRWPAIPLFSDAVEAMETLVRWQTLGPTQLTASLRTTLEQLAQLMDSPRQVALPVILAGQTAAAAADTLDASATALDGLLAALRRKVTVTFAQPSPRELGLLERQIEDLERLCQALDPRESPLTSIQDLPRRLELQLLRVIRTLNPAMDGAFLTQPVASMLGAIPDPEPDALAALVESVQDLDTSFLTDPMSVVKEQVEGAVAQVEAALDGVRQTLEAALTPVRDGLQDLLAAADLDAIIQALQGLPAQVQKFVQDQVQPLLDPVRDAIHTAIQAVSELAGELDPQALIQPIRDAMDQATALLRDPALQDAFTEIEDALQAAVDAVANLQMDAAADASIALIADVEQQLSSIDTSAIPDVARPLLEQAIEVVVNVDFTAEVSAPLLDEVTDALETGPQAVLDALTAPMAQLEAMITQFRPSHLVGDLLDGPFQELLSVLDHFQPSDLLEQLAQELSAVADKLDVADPAILVGPLRQVHQAVTATLETFQPTRLVEPVNQAIQDAIGRLFEISGVDDLFDGMDQILSQVRAYVDLLVGMRGHLDRIASLLADSGDMTAALDGLVQTVVARLDGVELNALGAAFKAVADTAAAIQRDPLAGQVVQAMRGAAQVAPDALQGPAALRIRELARSFPLIQLQGSRPVPSRRRLAVLIRRLLTVADRLEAAAPAWPALADDLRAHSAGFQEALLTYHRLFSLEGRGVFDDLLTPPADIPALQVRVAEALRDSLRVPTELLHGLFAAIAPHVAIGAAGLGDVLAAFHEKLDAVLGDQGVGGVVDSIEEAADLLRDLSLHPLTDPLDTLYQEILGHWSGLDPQPLEDALQAAVDAIKGLLDLSTLVDPADIQVLDDTWQAVVDAVALLSPGDLVSDVLDPVYEEALAPLLTLLDLPEHLTQLVQSSGDHLEQEILQELERVERAFDHMLHAIPLGGGSSITGSATLG